MGWFSQDRNEDTKTQVKSGYDKSHDTPVTEFIIADRDGSGHQHVVIDEKGDTLHNARVDGR
jgi:hypothetical protein